MSDTDDGTPEDDSQERAASGAHPDSGAPDAARSWESPSVVPSSVSLMCTYPPERSLSGFLTFQIGTTYVGEYRRQCHERCGNRTASSSGSRTCVPDWRGHLPRAPGQSFRPPRSERAETFLLAPLRGLRPVGSNRVSGAPHCSPSFAGVRSRLRRSPLRGALGGRASQSALPDLNGGRHSCSAHCVRLRGL